MWNQILLHCFSESCFMCLFLKISLDFWNILVEGWQNWCLVGLQHFGGFWASPTAPCHFSCLTLVTLQLLSRMKPHWQSLSNGSLDWHNMCHDQIWSSCLLLPDEQIVIIVYFYIEYILHIQQTYIYITPETMANGMTSRHVLLWHQAKWCRGPVWLIYWRSNPQIGWFKHVRQAM